MIIFISFGLLCLLLGIAGELLWVAVKVLFWIGVGLLVLQAACGITGYEPWEIIAAALGILYGIGMVMWLIAKIRYQPPRRERIEPHFSPNAEYSWGED